MADPFAIPSDIEDRWRPLTPEETARAETLLSDASADIRLAAPGIDDRIAAYAEDPRPTNSLDPDIPLAIACAMVKRVLLGGDATDGVNQASVTTGPFANSYTYSNPTGNLYLTKAERRKIGAIGKAGYVDMAPDMGVNYASPWCY